MANKGSAFGSRLCHQLQLLAFSLCTYFLASCFSFSRRHLPLAMAFLRFLLKPKSDHISPLLKNPAVNSLLSLTVTLLASPSGFPDPSLPSGPN